MTLELFGFPAAVVQRKGGPAAVYYLSQIVSM